MFIQYLQYFRKPAKGTVALIGTVKDEGPWLLEWIAHNKVLGFDEIAIASNDCTDGTAELLDRMQEIGLLTHINNPGPYQRTIQMDAYFKLQNLPKIKQCEWIIALDADEFLIVRTGKNKVQDLIELGKKCDRIPIRWRIFGDSGNSGFVDLPITDHLTQAATLDDEQNGIFKTLVKDHRHYEINVLFTSIWQPHARFGPQRFKKLKFFCDGVILSFKQGLPVRTLLNSVRSVTGSNTFAQINHYAVRTREICELKYRKGDPNKNQGKQGNQEYFDRLNLNVETDLSAADYKSERTKLIEEWLTDQTLATLHNQAVETTKNRISSIRFSE